jgi:antitoxin ParD1/3/4
MEEHMAAARNSIVVDLGVERRVVDERLASGAYATADEVIRAGLRALDREGADANVWLMKLAEESLADPEPSITAEDVFSEIYEKYSRGLGLQRASK